MNYELIVELLQNEVLELRVKLQEARAAIELRGQSVAALSRYCDEDRGTIAKLQEHNNELQSELESSKLDAKIWYENYDALLQSCEQLQSEKTNLLLHRNSLQAENNKLILERDELKTDLKEQIDAGMWLKHECDKIRKERDWLQNTSDALQFQVDELQKVSKADAAQIEQLQEKFERAKYELKIRNVIVIDDSIVRENNNG